MNCRDCGKELRPRTNTTGYCHVCGRKHYCTTCNEFHDGPTGWRCETCKVMLADLQAVRSHPSLSRTAWERDIIARNVERYAALVEQRGYIWEE